MGDVIATLSADGKPWLRAVAERTTTPA